MTNRPDIIQSLRQLEELDKVRGTLRPKSSKVASLLTKIEALREKLPTAILKHYDQRHARSMPAIVPVKQGVCGACHLRMNRSNVLGLHRSSGSIGVCENCGVFVYLNESEANAPEFQSKR